MGRLAKIVKTMIEQHFQGATAEVEEISSGRVVGSVIFDGFQNMEQIDRQTTVRSFLRGELGPEIQNVGVFLMYTPRELELMRAS